MWKCVHRGLRTSANLLKNDQSNGGCIVSSIISKDIDEIPSQSNDRSKCSHSDERFKRPIFKRERKIHTNQQPLAQDSRTNCSSVHSQIGDTITVLPKSLSFVPTNSQSKTRTTNADQIVVVHEWEEDSSSNLVSCRKCRQVYEEGPKCLCFSEIRKRSWLSRKLQVKNPYAHSSSTCVRQGALQRSASNPFLPTQHLSTHPSLVEDKPPNHSLITQKINSSLKFRDTASPTSFFQPYHTCKESRSDLERGHTLSPKGSQACQKFSYCLLKLPFLSYNYMRTKGFNQFYACWPNKSKNEFGGDDNKGQDNKDKRESEEAKNDSWRRYQTQQSLLEAIGLSSALLLGWFLAQCRVWRLCGEGHNSDHQRKLRKKRCILSRLLFHRKNNSYQILNAVPSDKRERNELDKKEEKGPVKNESRIALDNCNGESEGYFSELFKLDELQEKRSLNNFKSYLLNKEISSEAKRNLQKKVVHPGEEINGKSAIPMPWHTQQSKEYGPITLEEAFAEAGKSLEEAQAEILLFLALEKLEEESDVGASAVELLNSAAHLGNSAAAFNLGICYEMGVGGVKKDLSQAYHWYKIASDNGHAAAMYNIAVFHAQGLAGLNVNTKLAHQLLETASSLGVPEAADALTLLTSLKQTENPDVLQNDPVQEHNRHFSQSKSRSSLKDEESEMSFSSNDYDLDSKDIGASMKPKSSLYKKSKDARSTFSHVMESFSLVSSKLNENDSLCTDLVLDNTLSVKQSNFDYVSAVTFAQ